MVGWIGLLIGLFVLSSALGGEFKTDFELPGSESQAALDLLTDRGVSERTGFAGQVVFRSDNGVNDPAVRRAMERLFSEIETNLEDVRVASPYVPQNSYQVSEDGRVAYAEINFSKRDNEQYIEDADEVKDLREEVLEGAPAGLQVELGGDLFAEQPEFSSEAIGLFAAVIILLVAFGSVLAMGLPIGTALFGIGSGSALIGLVTRVLNVPDFTTQVAAMIGIGVGIDYALLIVTRYRSGLHDGLEPSEAVTLALDTSGRAVVFAGLTVVVSLLGIFFLNLDFMRSMAVGAVLAVLMTMLASVTLLPAMLGFVGHNLDRAMLRRPGVSDLINMLKAILTFPFALVRFFVHFPRFLIGLVREAPAPEPLRRPHPLSGEEQLTAAFWHRWSRFIQAHPWPSLFLSGAILIVLAIPVFSLRLGFADAGNRLEADTTRKAYDILSEGFGVGFNGPILVVVETRTGQSDASSLSRLKSAIEATDGVASVTDPQPVANGALQLINVFPESSPQDGETTELVHRLRREIDANVVSNTAFANTLTTGGPAFVVDFSDYMGERLPIFFGAVLILSFVLLMMVFHSVVVPLKAVIMNMLSIGASFGAMVAVFQWGFLGELIGLGKEGPIEAWAPMMLFAIIFGLSMDYEVFLLTRVREEYDRTGDNYRAVADGLAATGRVISAAAAIMVCVFGSFMLGDERALKLLGFGLAFAIFIDATVVRLVLVPATMELLGDLNWWMPRWLSERLPRLRVDGRLPDDEHFGGEASPVTSPSAAR